MSKKSKNNSNRRRDVTTYSIANRLRLPTVTPTARSFRPLSMYEDRRLYNPQGIISPARSFNKTRHRLTSTQTTNPIFPKITYAAPQIAFKAPSRVLVCVRRKIRKEVIHALNKAGKTGQKKPRRSEYSSIQC